MFDMKFDSRAFDRALDDLGALCARPTAFMRRPAEEWLAETEREQFASEGAAGASGTWPHRAFPRGGNARGAIPRSSAESAMRARPILQRSGNMMRVMTEVRSLRQLIEVTDKQIIFHLPSPAGFHQRGTRKMPARKVVDPSAAQIERLDEAVKREAAEAVRGLGVRVKR